VRLGGGGRWPDQVCFVPSERTSAGAGQKEARQYRLGTFASF
jgi:hypothetical protein